MADPVGPVHTGGFEEFVINDENGEQYTILFLPDRNNAALQREGKPPRYYWVPGSVRLARFGDTGDFKFRHTHFVGALDEDMHVGVDGKAEVVGGLLSLTTTSRYPTSVLKQAEEQLLAKFRGDNDRYWGWRTRAAPMISMAPIRSNRTVITNLSPGSGGTAPAEDINPPAPRDIISNAAVSAEGRIVSTPSTRNTTKLVRRAQLEGRRVIHGRDQQIKNLDAWAWEMQGQGPGSVTGGENAFSCLMGALPSELIWAGFQGGASPIVVAQHLQMPVWSQELYLKITGNWDRIFEHFSAHANAGFRWFSADIKTEFNNLRINGGIQVEMAVDSTIPGAEDMQDEINRRIDMIVDIFMSQATQRIFEPAPPEVEPAEAPSGGFFSRLFGGGGFALKYRRDSTRLNLYYEQTQHYRYLQPNTISSSFEGFYNLMKRDPEAEDKYFTRLVLGDLSRKVSRICKPVVNWPDPAKDWVGEPVSFLSAEVGYPGSQGSMQWDMNVFQSTDTTEESNWRPAFVRREEHEVNNPPQDWQPDITYIRRRVHLTEPMGMTDNPYIKLEVEQNVIDLDPEGGTPTTDNIIEVRADAAGKLEVGPIDIDVVLQDHTQVVTVEFQAEGNRADGSPRPVVKFQWKADDTDQPRHWEIFTGQLDYVPRYKYRVSVNVKGTLFSAGMAWTGPWMEGQGNGPLMVHVPRPGDEGVRSRSLSAREIRDVAEPVVVEGQKPVPPREDGVLQPPGRMVSDTDATNEHSGNGNGHGNGRTGRTSAGYTVYDPPGQDNPGTQSETAGSRTSDTRHRLKTLSDEEGWRRMK
jgi:hypothetical protein